MEKARYDTELYSDLRVGYSVNVPKNQDGI